MTSTKKQGTLTLNSNDRWEFSGFELTSGQGVEIELAKDVWVPGRIEHHGEYVFLTRGYEYTVQLKAGMKARLPGV